MSSNYIVKLMKILYNMPKTRKTWFAIYYLYDKKKPRLIRFV